MSIHTELEAHLPPYNYYRVNPTLEAGKNIELDQVSSENLERLTDLAESAEAQERISAIMERPNTIFRQRDSAQRAQ